jgi:DNA-binding IclR family transcriptional regulator
MNDPTRDPAPAVTRALRVLELLEQAGGAPLTLSDLARALGAAKSSTSNICAVLEEGGMIRRAEAGYRLGRRTAELGGAFAHQFNQVREFYGVVESDPVLRGEVVQVAMLDGDTSLYLARHEGRAHRLGTPLGSRLAAVSTGVGLAMLSRLDDAVIDEVIARTAAGGPSAGSTPSIAGSLATAGTPATGDIPSAARIPSGAEIRAQIAEARARGYSVDPGHGFDGIWGVAVPLEPWRPSDPQLALGVAIPAAEADEATVERVGRAALAVAAQLTNPFLRPAD